MEVIQETLIRTPIWVWFLLVYLISRGLKARRPSHVKLAKLALIPVLFTAWAIYDLVRLYGLTATTGGIWLAGAVLGAGAGWLLLARAKITADRPAGALALPADNTLLPLLLLTFAIKFAFGVMAAVSPDLLAETGFRAAHLILSGFFIGVFIGKFTRYCSVFFAAPAPAQG